MRVLLLGPPCERIEEFLVSEGVRVARTEKPISLEDGSIADDVGWIVSYRYRHIITPSIIAAFQERIINLHLSYLPWNRGADPNLWSILENTPKGVSIHFIDEGLDTGDIVAQQQVELDSLDTLVSSYQRLTGRLEDLFMKTWPDLRDEKLEGCPQPEDGSCHKAKDRETIEHLLETGWNTPVAGLREHYERLEKLHG